MKKKEEKWETESVEGEEEKSPKEPASPPKKSWTKKTGELAVDVYETEESIVIQSPVAGVKKNDLEIITEKDMIIVKGKRERTYKKEIKGFYTQECFYGDFRREIILPEETDPSRIEANMEEGVLTIEVPKIEREKRRRVDI